MRQNRALERRCPSACQIEVTGFFGVRPIKTPNSNLASTRSRPALKLAAAIAERRLRVHEISDARHELALASKA